MKLIGEWKPAGATDALLTVLRSDAAPTALIAACEALGRLADPAGVDALAEIATPKGMLFFRKRRPIPVRVAAALALKQINDPRVAPVLAALARDVDPRLRSLTKSLS
jgi:HEAT repeat protein